MRVELTLPIYWQQTRSKTVLVSMNAYRNWHYHTSNKFKQEFTELVSNQIPKGTKLTGEYELEIHVFYKNPNCDASNITALVEKVVLDALQKDNVLVSDSVKHHVKTTWVVEEQDKVNPRAEIIVRELNGIRNSN